MKAVIYRVRSVLRRRLAATLGVTLIVTVVCGVVIAFAAGANRTSTAPDRYTSAFGGVSDARLIQDDRGKPLDRKVAALPGVESVESMSFIFGGLSDASGNNLDFALEFAGSFHPSGVRLVDGRAADPANEHEFVATRNFVRQSNLKIGDELNLVTLTPEQSLNGYDLSDPQGPRLSIKMVGVVDGASQLDDGTPLIFISPALLAENVGLSETLMDVDLRPGVDLATLRAELDAAEPAVAALSLDLGTLISQPVRDAVQAQARGLWILTAVAAIAAIAVLGQVMTRQVRPTQEERERLSAIGFTQSQILADAIARAVIPITIGSLLGAAVAALGSDQFPFGFARVLEPSPGLRVDWAVALGGAALFVVALTLWTVAVLGLSGRQNRAVRPSPLVEALATRSGSATAGVGMRLAFGRRARERGSVRGSVVGVLLSVAGVVAATTFGVSLNRLVEQPFRYGSNYDASVGDNGAETLPDGMVARLDADPDVTSLTLFAGSQARFGDRTIPMLGLEVVRGDGHPIMLEGRLPTSDDEIALGRLTAADIGAQTGDDIELVGATQSQVFRVTGLAVVPGLGANDGLGSGGIVTMGGLTRIDSKALVTSAAVNLRVSLEKFFSSIPEFANLPPNPVYRPASIRSVARIRAIPFILAAVLAGLALLTVGHVMVTSMRTRRRDLAILRSLGADRGWITRAVHWQATVLTALPVVVGIPVGIVLGRLIFGAFADSMGAVRDAAMPLLTIAVGGFAVVIVANGVAAVVSRRTRRRDPALLLQSE
ncbi:MAG: putative transport system permease protein [Ilumatobacteraceae bacterium]